MVFRDSRQLLPTSLELLVASLTKTGRKNLIKKYKLVATMCSNCDVTLLERKGVFCYNYIDSFEQLEEQAHSHREAFCNKLSNEECLEADYVHSKHVSTEFNCKTLKDYLSLHLLSDICLLADVFETLRNNSLEEYQLDPAYYVSAL